MVRPRLLVVDDDPYLRNGMSALFVRQGWQVEVAATVAEGLARLDAAPDCVILDLNLPDGGGESLLGVIRARLPRTRVAVCSGEDDPSRLEGVRRLRPELMLWKPFDVGPLMQLCGAAPAPA